jgi:hypothetical protein
MLKHLYSLLLIALFAGTLSITAATAHAEFREEGVALIERKGPNALMFDGHGFKHFVDRYMEVSSLTRCYDETGVQINFVDLKFPCKARILYRIKNSGGMPEAISIHVEYYRDERIIGAQWNLPFMKPADPQ